MRNRNKTLRALLMTLSLTLSLTLGGCSLFADPDSKLLMKIDDRGYTPEECLLLEEACLGAAADLFSAGCWETSIQGVDFADYMKNTVKENVMNILVFAAMAQEEGVTLTAEEEVSAGYVAEHYMDALDRKCSDSREKQIREAALLYCQARKYEDSIRNLAGTGISEEDARVIRGRQIVFSFNTPDERGEAKKRVDRVKELLAQGKGFNQVTSYYTDAEEIEITLAKNEAEEWQKAFFSVEAGKVSEPLERENCYVIFQMRETNVRKLTQVNRERMQEAAADALIRDTYNRFAASHNVTWNFGIWETVDIRQTAEEAGEVSLFSVYREVFK